MTQKAGQLIDSPPSAAALGRWLNGWVQPDGAIHGFHNHSVWGSNPYHFGDFTAGHSTFASPMALGLAAALRGRPDARGQELLERLLTFQSGSFQADGQFEHVGFQVGEMLKSGLIHNAVPCAAMCGAAAILGDRLPGPLRARIDAAVRRNLAALDARHGPGASAASVTNQEYARQWARLLHMQAFGHDEWDAAVIRDIDFLIGLLHVPGVPDDACAGTLRHTADPDLLEPAEYYGLMIHPLVIASERFGRPDYLDEAFAIARHVVRSSWTDACGHRRVHRLWQRLGGRWVRIREPMLIGGIGITLSGIQALVGVRADAELSGFLDEMDGTYAGYQSGAGFFLSATGWAAEQDIIPSTAWQSHDFYHLLARHGADEGFWDAVFAPDERVAVVFGPSMIWMEAGPHWTVQGYHTAHGLRLLGRKDRVRFGPHIAPWIGSGREMPAEYAMPDLPTFVRTDDAIVRLGGRDDLHVLSAQDRPYAGGV